MDTCKCKCIIYGTLISEICMLEFLSEVLMNLHKEVTGPPTENMALDFFTSHVSV